MKLLTKYLIMQAPRAILMVLLALLLLNGDTIGISDALASYFIDKYGELNVVIAGGFILLGMCLKLLLLSISIKKDDQHTV